MPGEGVWSARAAAPARGRGLSAAAFILSVFLVLTYSEAWVYPILGERTDEASSALIRDLFFPAYAGALALVALRPATVLRVLAREPFLLLILAVAACSVTWSVAPDQSLRRVVAILFTTMSGVALGARWRWGRLVEVFACAFAILVAASLITGLFLPELGRMQTLFPGAWRGLWVEKNNFGGMMTLAILVFLPAALFAPRRAGLWLGFAALALALLLLSTSKTALLALMLGLAALGFVLLARRGGAMAVVAVYAGVMSLVALGAAIWLAPDALLALLGKDATLTGRTRIWTAVIGAIRQRPWLGYGYGAVWTDTDTWAPLARIVKSAGFKPEHAHNSWLEQWLGVGLVGLVAWSLYYLTTLARAVWAVFTSRGALIVFPFLMVYSLTSLTESVAVVYNDLRWVMFVALAARLALPQAAPEG